MSTQQERWESVDEQLADRYIGRDPELSAVLAATQADARSGGLPEISVSAMQGRMLEVLARAVGAARILEIGTLGGYSTIWLARGLPAGGRLLTLELQPHHADVARANLQRAGLADRVEVRVGPAAESLQTLAAEGADAFDLIFIDADKRGYPEYLRLCLPLLRPGGLLVADNVVRRFAAAVAPDGAAADPADPDIEGIRRFHDLLAAEPGLTASTIQTVGAKGYDGFALAVKAA